MTPPQQKLEAIWYAQTKGWISHSEAAGLAKRIIGRLV